MRSRNLAGWMLACAGVVMLCAAIAMIAGQYEDEGMFAGVPRRSTSFAELARAHAAMMDTVARRGTPPEAAIEPPAAAPTPTLREILESADALVRAGVMAPPPWMRGQVAAAPVADEPTLEQILLAADELMRAGVIERPEPTLEESLMAVERIAQFAGALPATQTKPPLIEVLQAAALLAEAERANTQQAAAAPPPPPTVALPPPAPATATPVPAALPPPPPAAVAAAPGGWYDDGFSVQVLAAVNQRRTGAGLGALSPEPRLGAAAANYAQVLAVNDWFSHTGPDGSTLVSRVEAAGFPFTVQVGEVLAWGTNGWLPAEIVQAWLDSPGHRDQIMGDVYVRAGVSCYFTAPASTTVRCVMDLAG